MDTSGEVEDPVLVVVVGVVMGIPTFLNLLSTPKVRTVVMVQPPSFILFRERSKT